MAKPYSDSYPELEDRLWNLMQKYLESRGLSFELAKANGWYPSLDAGDDSPRVVIPCYSSAAENMYWQGRRMTSLGALRYESPHGCNRGDALVRVMPKGEVKGTVVCEGPMDALAAAEVGYVGLGMMGTHPTPEAVETARRVAAGTPVSVVADEGALGAAAALTGHFPGARLVVTYPHKDLADVPREKRGDYLA